METKLLGILLAGGRGERMGLRPKALMPIGESTFMGMIVETMRKAGIEDITVVLGFHADEVRPYVPKGVDIAVNPNPEKDMLSSLLTGLKSASAEHTGGMIALTDYPLVKLSTYKLLIEEHRKNPGCLISPVHDNHGGHPVIFPRVLFDELASAPLEIGARHVVRANPELRRFVAVDDPGISIDINTPELYEKHIGSKFGEKPWL